MVATLGALLVSAGRVGAQRIDPIPALGEMGSDAVVTVTTDQGAPLPGVVVKARSVGGADVDLGATDQHGAVRFSPREPGRYEFRIWLPEQELTVIAPYEVLPQRQRWLWALVCVPAGLVLLWLNVRRLRR